MSEVMATRLSHPSFDRQQYAGSPLGWLERQYLEKEYGSNPVDFYAEIFERVRLSGQELVLDVGCGDGRGIIEWRQPPYNYSGQLVGIDVQGSNFYTWQQNKTQGVEPIHFAAGGADALPLRDGIAHLTMAVLMLYHAASPSRGLDELYRVTRPGGTLALVTSGRNKKLYHTQVYQDMAVRLGTTPPPPFTDRFNDEIAARELPRLFPGGYEHIIFEDLLQIPASGWNDLEDSLASLRSGFGRRITTVEWESVIKSVKENFLRTVAMKGFLTERIEHHLFLCTKD